MSIKLPGASDGSVEIDVPASCGSDLSVTIPATTGDIVIKGTDGSVDLGAIDIAASAPADSVNIDSSGRLLVGTSSTTQAARAIFQANNSSDAGVIRLACGTSTPSNGEVIGSFVFAGNDHDNVGDIYCSRDGGTWTQGSSQPTRLVFSTTADGASAPTERMRIDSVGRFSCQGIYDNTSAVSGNVTVNSSGRLQRATSSSKYKTNIETLEDSYADAVSGCRPVWYRSTCEGDNPNHGWWGFIAEEVAEIDPRLVHWKTVEVTYDEKGSAVETPCDPEPEGVAYDRFVPHLLNLIKRQKEQIEAMETRLTALEGGAS